MRNPNLKAVVNRRPVCRRITLADKIKMGLRAGLRTFPQRFVHVLEYYILWPLLKYLYRDYLKPRRVRSRTQLVYTLAFIKVPICGLLERQY